MHFTGMSEGVRTISADITCDSDFEPIAAAGSWERARVMEASSEDTARAL